MSNKRIPIFDRKKEQMYRDMFFPNTNPVVNKEKEELYSKFFTSIVKQYSVVGKTNDKQKNQKKIKKIKKFTEIKNAKNEIKISKVKNY